MRMSRPGAERWRKERGQEAMKTGMGRGFVFTRLSCSNTVTCFEAVSDAGGELAMRKNAVLWCSAQIIT
jgi:hypothetical protein